MNFQAYTLKKHPDWALIQVKMPESEIRTPVHLCCVIDTSASMENDNKLENVKQSLLFLLDFLGPQDMLSVVTFSENAKTIISKTNVTTAEKESIRARISLIRSESNTNLSGGIVVVRDSLLTNTLNIKQGILLLTDGVANMGLTRSDDILELVGNTILSYSGTSISCIGYGTDHNIELLQSITTHGGGSYYVVNNIEDVAVVFGDVLGGLVSCVSQQVRISLPIDTEVKTRYATNRVDDKMEIVIGDMPAGMEAAFLAKIPTGSSVNLRGYDLQVHRGLDMNVNILDIDDTNLQIHGEAHYLRFEVLAVLDQSRTLLLHFASAADIQQLIDKINSIINLINDHKRNNDHSLWNILLEELNSCKESLENRNNNGIETPHLMTQHAGYLGRMRGIPADMSQSGDAHGLSPVSLDRTFSNFAQRTMMNQLHASVTPVINRQRRSRNSSIVGPSQTQDPITPPGTPLHARSPLMRAIGVYNLIRTPTPQFNLDPIEIGMCSPTSSLSS